MLIRHDSVGPRVGNERFEYCPGTSRFGEGRFQERKASRITAVPRGKQVRDCLKVALKNPSDGGCSWHDPVCVRESLLFKEPELDCYTLCYNQIKSRREEA